MLASLPWSGGLNPESKCRDADSYCIAMEISQPSSANEFHPVTAGRSGPGPNLGTVLPAGVSFLARLRKRQGERVLSPRAGRRFVGQRRPALRPGTIIVAVIHRLKPTKAKIPKRWNTLRISAWGFWAGLIYGLADQFLLSDYDDDFLSENTVSSIAPVVWAAVCGAVLFALVSAVRNVIVRAKR